MWHRKRIGQASKVENRVSWCGKLTRAPFTTGPQIRLGCAVMHGWESSDSSPWVCRLTPRQVSPFFQLDAGQVYPFRPIARAMATAGCVVLRFRTERASCRRPRVLKRCVYPNRNLAAASDSRVRRRWETASSPCACRLSFAFRVSVWVSVSVSTDEGRLLHGPALRPFVASIRPD